MKKANGNNSKKAVKLQPKPRAARYESSRIDAGVPTNLQIDSVIRTPSTVSKRIEQRTEFIAPIGLGIGAGQLVLSIELNPGLPQFGWLNRVARVYEWHHLKSMRVEYRPSAATTAQGVVTMAFDYDPNDGSPVNRQQLTAFAGAASAAVRLPFSIEYRPTDVGGGAKWRAVRSNAMASYVTSGNVAKDNLMLYDFGTLYVWTSDSAVAGVAGDIYITYEWELHTPQMPSVNNLTTYFRAGLSNPPSVTWLGTGVADIPNFIGGYGGTNPSGTIHVFHTAVPGTGFNLTFAESGEYICIFNIIGTGFDDLSTMNINLPPGASSYVAGRLVDITQVAEITTGTVVGSLSLGDSSVNLATAQSWQFHLRLPSPMMVVGFNTASVSTGTRTHFGVVIMGAPFLFVGSD